jgi:hypothetical protein
MPQILKRGNQDKQSRSPAGASKRKGNAIVSKDKRGGGTSAAGADRLLKRTEGGPDLEIDVEALKGKLIKGGRATKTTAAKKPAKKTNSAVARKRSARTKPKSKKAA